MRVAFLTLNALGLVAVLRVVAMAAFLCVGVVTCAAHVPRTLTVGGGVAPVLCFVGSTAVAVLAVRRRASTVLSLVGLALGAIASYTSLLAFAVAVEFVWSGGFENAVPSLLYGSLGILALIPTVAVLNVCAIARRLTQGPRSSGGNAA